MSPECSSSSSSQHSSFAGKPVAGQSQSQFGEARMSLHYPQKDRNLIYEWSEMGDCGKLYSPE